MLAFNSLVVGSLRRNYRHAIGNSLYRPSAATTTIGHVCAPSPISCGFSTKSIKSSIPVINETIESSCESKLYLVDHPYELTGYQAPTSSSNSNSPIDVSKTGVFAVVDFSGSQYKISPDDVIVADKLEDVDVDSVVDLDKVLLVGSKTATLVGSPLISGSQYKISPDDVIVADKLEDVDVDSVVDLDKVLLVGSKTATLVGVVDFSGSQYKISPDDVIVADKLEDVDVDSVVDLDKVLLVGSKTATLVGSPLISSAKVQAVVEEIAKDKKVIALKYRRRKNSKRIRGFRRQVTILRIKDIVLTEDQNNDLGL
eukprot:CAMPEP_0174974232 /NCGR_PEP_ID=MMETSP0004_2-20121128/11712_1 /TAXON_ID=420556 /ORGANISM="Ochromonas sp., Strain CCMP1393" /LENGTH=312 /DNA_ID=CAMNT_0016224827 /DNA_START=120 /DNA_END=1058 /DNA_ORIENTATION=+